MTTNNSKEKILYKELSYKIQGLFFNIRKAAAFVTKQESARIYDYLRNGKYELAYLVNFASSKLYVRRFLFTNDRKHWVKNIILFVAISVSFVAISGLSVMAAKLELISPMSETGVGQQFQVDLTLDTEGADINAVQGKITFPANLLELKEVRDGDSIINFWIQKPSRESESEVSFSGVIPGGFSGVLSPYYKGEKSGKIFSLIFTGKSAGESLILIKDAKILLNDGLGTEAKTSVQNSFVAIRDYISGDSRIMPKDTDPPELFTPEIASDPDIFDGKRFLVFSVQDKGSGVDYYAVHETTQRKDAAQIDSGEWTPVESPYLLKDQSLKSYIYIKAVDKAGNARIVYLPPTVPWYKKWFVDIIFGVIIIGVIILVRWLLKKLKIKSEK